MTQPTRLERKVWKARVFGCADSYMGESALALLKAEHAAIRRKVQQFMTERGNEYLKDSVDKRATPAMQQLAAGRAWAIKDLRDDLLTMLEAMGK